MQDMVNQLFALPAREAAKVVLSNAREGKKTVKELLDSAAPLDLATGMTVSDHLEADLRNATISYVNNIICVGIGGTAAWIAVSAFFQHQTQGRGPMVNDVLKTGAVLVLVLRTYDYTIQFLEEVLEKPLLLAAAGWFLWVIQAMVSRVRQLAEHIRHL